MPNGLCIFIPLAVTPLNKYSCEVGLQHGKPRGNWIAFFVHAFQQWYNKIIDRRGVWTKSALKLPSAGFAYCDGLISCDFGQPLQLLVGSDFLGGREFNESLWKFGASFRGYLFLLNTVTNRENIPWSVIWRHPNNRIMCDARVRTNNFIVVEIRILINTK